MKPHHWKGFAVFGFGFIAPSLLLRVMMVMWSAPMPAPGSDGAFLAAFMLSFIGVFFGFFSVTIAAEHGWLGGADD